MTDSPCNKHAKTPTFECAGCLVEMYDRQVAEISRLTAENERLRKLCPSMVDVERREPLSPDSTITVAVGYLHTLLEASEQLAEALELISEAYFSGRQSVAWGKRAVAVGPLPEAGTGE